MLPVFSSRPEVFLPKDRQTVSEACQVLYKLDTPIHLNVFKRYSELIRKGAFSALAAIGGGTSRVHGAIDAANIRRILIFRYDAIGDYIVTSPFVSWVRNVLPNVEIDVVGSYRNAPMLRMDPNFSEVIAIHPRHGFHPSWGKVRKLSKRKQYDVVAALVFTRMTKAAVLALEAGRDATRLTIKHRERFDIYGKVFDVQVPHHMGKSHWMETMGNVGPTMLGIPTQTPQPYVIVDEVALRSVRLRLSAFEVQHKLPVTNGLISARGSKDLSEIPELEGAPYILFNISAYSPNRQWQAEIAVMVAREVADQIPGMICFVTGGPEAHEEIGIAVNKLQHSRVYMWSGSILELIPLIAGASVVVTPDTAALHIAATSQRPVVGLYAELIKVAEWFPFGTDYRALLSHDTNTINAIPIRMIVEAVLQLVP